MSSTRRRTDAATLEHMRRSAHRAAGDPATLAHAARVVRAALNLGKLTPGDLSGDTVKPSDLGTRLQEVSGDAS